MGILAVNTKTDFLKPPFTFRKGKGACGASWEQSMTLVVADVDAFPGHIARSSDSKSEVVVPIFKENVVIGVLDVDSDTLDSFDTIDQVHLEKMMAELGARL